MIVAFAMLVVALGSVGWYVWRLVHWDEPRIGRADTRPAPWFQLASYAGGRVTHLTPMRDRLHFEDEDGECPCHPTSGAYRTVDDLTGSDRVGVLYVHHILDDRLDRV